MSSFVGHSLAAVAIYAVSNRRLDTNRIGKLVWLVWLLIVACLPDIDYVIEGRCVCVSMVRRFVLPIL
ncbi:MAG: hypothetical protein AAGA83_07895 [Cyanobacteria bacterium P01_F01_bin.116]